MLQVWKCTHLEPVVPLHQQHTSLSLLFFSPELNEAQQKLLVKSMEKKILPVQLKLVRKITADTRESSEGSQLEPVER